MTTTTPSTTLKPNEQIRVKGFSSMAGRITIGTVRSCAAKWGDNPEEAEARALRSGHDLAFANQDPAILTADYTGKKDTLGKAAKSTATATEVADGQIVEIEGNKFKVKVTSQRYSDPVKFLRF
mgnify:CR=1 FL=1